MTEPRVVEDSAELDAGSPLPGTIKGTPVDESKVVEALPPFYSREPQTLTGERVIAIRSGFNVLKERKLDAAVERRVIAQYQMLKPAFDHVDALLRQIQLRIDKVRKMKDLDMRTEELLDCKARERAVYAMRFVVGAPKTRLEMKDLPTEYEGEGGKENPRGAAGVVIALAPEFFVPLDEE